MSSQLAIIAAMQFSACLRNYLRSSFMPRGVAAKSLSDFAKSSAMASFSFRP